MSRPHPSCGWLADATVMALWLMTPDRWPELVATTTAAGGFQSDSSLHNAANRRARGRLLHRDAAPGREDAEVRPPTTPMTARHTPKGRTANAMTPHATCAGPGALCGVAGVGHLGSSRSTEYADGNAQ